MSGGKTLARRIVIVAVGLGLILVLAVAGAILAVQTEQGRLWLAAEIEALLAVPGESSVRIGGIGPGLPLRLTLADITLADNNGPWLEARNLRFSWRPWALFARRLSISELVVAELHILRAPQGGTSAPDKTEQPPVEIPKLPVALRIDRIGVDVVQIDKPVLGRAMRLSVDGRLASRGGRRVLSQLDIDRLPDAEGQEAPNGGRQNIVHIAVDYDLTLAVLDVDAAVHEPADGLIVGLMGIPARPPLDATLAGQGPIADWHGALVVEAANWARLTADLTVRATGSGRGLSVAGRLDPQADLVPALRPALSQGVTFAADLNAPSDDEIQIDRLSIEAAGAAMNAAGRLGVDRSKLDASVDVSIDAAALAPGLLGSLRMDRATAHAIIDGALAKPDVTADGSIIGIEAPDLRAERLDWRARASSIHGDENQAAVTALKADVQLIGAEAASPIARSVVGRTPTLQVDAAFDEPHAQLVLRSLDLTAAGAQLHAQAGFGVGDGALEASAELTIPDLNPIAAAVGQSALGSGHATLSVNGNVEQRTIDGTGSLNFSGLRSGIAAADALLGGEPRLETGFHFDNRAGLNVARLHIAARNVEGEGSARISADFAALDSRFRLEVPTLVPLSKPLGTALGGHLTIDAAASGNLVDPSVRVIGQLRDGLAGGVRVASAHVEFDTADTASRPNGRVSAQATSDLGPMTAMATFVSEPAGRLHLAPVTVTVGGASLDADIVATLDAGLLSGTAHARVNDPRAGVRIGENLMRGLFDVDMAFAGDGGRQRITARAGGRSIVWSEADEQQAAIGSLEADATIDDAFTAPGLSANVTVGDASIGPARIERLNAHAGGTMREMRLSLAANGPRVMPAPAAESVDASGILTQDGNTIRLRLDRLDGRLGGRALALQRPAVCVSSPGRVTLDGLALAVGEGRLNADAGFGPGETTAKIEATALPVGLARLLSDTAPSSGKLDLTLALGTQGKDTTGDASIRLSGVGLDTGHEPTKIDARFRAVLGAGVLTVEGNVNGPHAPTLALAGRLPIRLPAGATAPIVDQTALIDGSMRVDGDVGELTSLLALPDQRIAGSLKGDVRFGGSLAAPTIDGGINVENGTYENFVSGTLLRDLALHLTARDPRTLDVSLTGSDAGNGRIAAKARAGLTADGSLDVTGTARAQNATLVRRDDVTATTNADLTYSATGETARLAGRIETSTIEIRLLDRLPPSVVILPVTEIGGHAAGPQGQNRGGVKEQEKPAFSAALDVVVSLPSRVFVRGRGLDSEWSGALTVTGTTDEPQIRGTIAFVRGSFTFAGKRFVFDRGTITFTGGQPPDPIIDAVAKYTASNITAQIGISGLASHPEISITSQPPLPESEILSQVLFNKSSAKLGPVEAVQLAAAVDSLARGESMTDDAFSFARTLLGLDTLTVQPNSDNSGGSSVAVGRYVGDRVYIGAEQGIESGSQAGSVEVEILPGISIESELQQNTTGTQGAFGLKWKWDY
ncbi:MAG: translocation/assembly module TamB domain-containing protein [Rhodospirillales bacterium]|nr:translocation/assembly module TamB domain-containing protein [Rhodospirillales bacterium]